MVSLLSPCEAKSNHSFSRFNLPNSCEEFAEPIRHGRIQKTSFKT